MFDIGGGELLLILLIVVVLFGPKKLPELMQGLGKGMREFKKAQREFTDHINTAFEEEQRKSHRQQSVRTSDTIARRPAEPIPPPPVDANSSANEPTVDTPPAEIPAGTMARGGSIASTPMHHASPSEHGESNDTNNLDH